MPEPTLDERVSRLEDLLDKAIDAARRHPAGRIILAKLGLR